MASRDTFFTQIIPGVIGSDKNFTSSNTSLNSGLLEASIRATWNDTAQILFNWKTLWTDSLIMGVGLFSSRQWEADTSYYLLNVFFFFICSKLPNEIHGWHENVHFWLGVKTVIGQDHASCWSVLQSAVGSGHIPWSSLGIFPVRSLQDGQWNQLLT